MVTTGRDRVWSQENTSRSNLCTRGNELRNERCCEPQRNILTHKDDSYIISSSDMYGQRFPVALACVCYGIGVPQSQNVPMSAPQQATVALKKKMKAKGDAVSYTEYEFAINKGVTIDAETGRCTGVTRAGEDKYDIKLGSVGEDAKQVNFGRISGPKTCAR